MIPGQAQESTENQRKLTRGLIIGRFQPFHKGHLDLVYQVLEEIKELIIVIGSSQHNYIFKDPFTAGERLLMIHQTLVKEKIDLSRIYVVPIPNFENNAAWLAYLQSMVPTFNVIYSGNEFVSILVKSQISKSRNSKSDIEVRRPVFKNKLDYNGENIRNLIKSGKKWKHLVHPQVVKVIEMVDGVNRIKVISRTDSNPLKW